ncbi:MAG: DUF4143 domain-containing protein [Chitinivibrionales bacterium]|nr:DUF4143 domain-containing protein [Chitinivibrionales bacterium]MBD3396215.1 DUF4143 domain-containing protein [Chitinivibrionales bacterium]
MAGRAAVFRLLPFSREETAKAGFFQGGYPEAVAKPSTAQTWFRSYVQTYLERDVRALCDVRDLSTYRRFMALLATRTGRIINRTELASSLGVSVPTISSWLSVLEITGHILLVPPFFENFGKRLVKSSKVYFLDSGLACHLVGIESEQALNRSPFLWPIFEGFVASEIVKMQINSNRSQQIFFFRDRLGLEVDFLVPLGERRLALLEAKATRTPGTDDAEPVRRLAASIRKHELVKCVVHRKARGGGAVRNLGDDVRAVTVDGLRARLYGHR